MGAFILAALRLAEPGWRYAGAGVRLLVLSSADRVQGDWITAGPADQTAARAE